ncbi:MAG: energy transducer TonB [Pseudomonadota bacterium]
MNTGQIISGTGHVGLLIAAIFGGAFQSDPLPFEVTEVTSISAEEYAALVAPDPEPDALANIDTPEPPEAGQSPDLPVAVEEAAPEASQPEVGEATQPDPIPEVEELGPPPQAELSDNAPVLQPPEEDVAVLLPETAEEPVPQPAPRVAPEPVAQPEPDVRIDDVDQQAAEPDEQADQVEPETEETAQEEAADRIVTEADELAAAAPKRSVRPKSRPTRATEAPETQTTQEDTTDEEAVTAALQQALGQNDGPAENEPSGPPLTAGEKDALRVAVQRCWNVGSLSSDALATTVVVGVAMGEDGRPINGTIELLDSSGGSNSSARQAFEAARRAIIRCGSKGFDLPVGKYASWREIEMTFNPERMRIK